MSRGGTEAHAPIIAEPRGFPIPRVGTSGTTERFWRLSIAFHRCLPPPWPPPPRPPPPPPRPPPGLPPPPWKLGLGAPPAAAPGGRLGGAGRVTATRPDCRPVAAWRPPPRPAASPTGSPASHPATLPGDAPAPRPAAPPDDSPVPPSRHHRSMPRTSRQNARQVAVTGPADAWTLARAAARGNALPRSRLKPARPGRPPDRPTGAAHAASRAKTGIVRPPDPAVGTTPGTIGADAVPAVDVDGHPAIAAWAIRWTHSPPTSVANCRTARPVQRTPCAGKCRGR
jgi:hypothetical protein